MDYQGTLHIGNHCNNNYKLFKALRTVSVDAHFVFFERLARENPLSNPFTYDSDFDLEKPFIHIVDQRFRNERLQKAYELVRIGSILKRFKKTHWIHAQTDFPSYVSLFCDEYSAHSTGSDLRVDYFRAGIKDKVLNRAYRKARVVFFNNIDLYKHDLNSFTRFCFLPNVVDFSKFDTVSLHEKRSDRMQILMPSRITFFNNDDIKGNRVFYSSLQLLMEEADFQADLTISKEDPFAEYFKEKCLIFKPKIDVKIKPFKWDRARYLDELIKADFIIDQFVLGAMGGSALDCFAMRKVALVNNDPKAIQACYGVDFPLPQMNSDVEIKNEILNLRNRQYLEEMENSLFNWVMKFHDQEVVARCFLDKLDKSGISVSKRDLCMSSASHPAGKLEYRVGINPAQEIHPT